MEEVKESVVTLLIVFVVLKLVDFNHMSLLDYMLMALAAVYMVISIVMMLRKGDKDAKR